jgi:hypothetical protein
MQARWPTHYKLTACGSSIVLRLFDEFGSCLLTCIDLRAAPDAWGTYPTYTPYHLTVGASATLPQCVWHLRNSCLHACGWWWRPLMVQSFQMACSARTLPHDVPSIRRCRSASLARSASGRVCFSIMACSLY